ncbi:MAG: hypothetical protein GX605_02220, partial [Chloroflexi bacterium]|nr:hypothetical protein [Chloroflexota bacterium]
MRQRFITMAGILALVLLVAWPLAVAEEPPVVKGADQRQGNYCVECHASPVDGTAALAWQGDILSESEAPCVTLRRTREEVFYTESLLGAVESISPKPAVLEEALTSRRQGYVALLQTPVRSYEALSGASGQARMGLSRIYARLHDARDTRTLWSIYAVAAAVTLALASGLFLAWRIIAHRGGRLRLGTGALVGLGVAALLAFVIFLWPFPDLTDPNAAMSQGDTVRQSSTDKAEAAALSAEQAMAKGWVLSSIAADWAQLDREAAQPAFDDGQSAMQALAASRNSYLADVDAVAAGAINWRQADAALVSYLEGRIRDAAFRTWGWREAAAAWRSLDRQKADELLAAAVVESSKEPSVYFRDLDLAGIAFVWGEWDPHQAEKTLGLVYDPFIQAQTWTRLGQKWQGTQQGQQAFQRSLATAQGVADGYQRFLALQALGEAWKASSDAMHRVTLAAARDAIDSISSSRTAAYALARWAGAWAAVDAEMALSSVQSIDSTLQEPRILGFQGMAEALRGQDDAGAETYLALGWDETAGMSRSLDRDKARWSLLGVWAAVNPAAAEGKLAEMRQPAFVSLAQKEVALGWAQTDPERALALAG